MNIKSNVFAAVIVFLFMSVLTGLIYPLAVTGVAKAVFSEQAEGSMIYKDDKAVGSKLIGQRFSDDKYFHGRPSVAGEGYDAGASSGSNLGPTNKALLDEVGKRAVEFRDTNGLAKDAKVPADIVTASGSGLDPDISPEAAYLQVGRVAKARGVSKDKVKAVVDSTVENRTFGVFGEKRVNVLELNLALDEAAK
jgi:potassium-transporting ATPase KdpC subunit